MKIIEEGILAANKVHRQRCTKCKALYEFQTHEGRIVHDNRDGDYIVTICPTQGCDARNSTAVNINSGGQQSR